VAERLQQVRVLEGVQPDQLPDEVLAPDQPLLLKGLVRDWPMNRAGMDSSAAAMAYLRRFIDKATVNAVRLHPRHRGRVFYNEDMSGFNFEAERLRLDAVLDELHQLSQQSDPH
jgi:hypothetical protein